MRILIVEDEPMAATRLQQLVLELEPSAQVLTRLDSVKRTVTWLKSNEIPDLILLDIQLADGISFQIFDEVSVQCPIIFTTAYNEYALRAFKVNSIDYILKPIDKEELKQALEKFKRLTKPVSQPNLMESIANAMELLTKKYKTRFVVKVGEHLRSIETSEILFFYSQDKTTFAQTTEGRKHILDYTMEQVEEMMDPAKFFRISRKYMVTANSIQDMINYTNSRLRLVLKTSDDKEIIVARERVQEFKSWLDR
jgi:DNA-binding LytR/AlgR family response regulator